MIKKFRIFEYFTWNEEVDEKTIDLGKLYNQQEGNLDHILQILQYEFRNQPDNNFIEYKKITLHSNNYDIWKLTNNTIEKNRDGNGIIFRAEYGGLYNFDLKSFKHYHFKIKIIKKKFNKEDPYGEEVWDD